MLDDDRTKIQLIIDRSRYKRSNTGWTSHGENSIYDSHNLEYLNFQLRDTITISNIRRFTIDGWQRTKLPIDDNHYIIGYNGKFLKYSKDTGYCELLGLVAADIGKCIIDADIHRIEDNPYREPLLQTIIESIDHGLFVDYSYYEKYMLEKRPKDVFVRFLKKASKDSDIAIYPIENINNLILRKFDYKRLYDKTKRLHPELNGGEVITNLAKAFDAQDISEMCQKLNALQPIV